MLTLLHAPEQVSKEKPSQPLFAQVALKGEGGYVPNETQQFRTNFSWDCNCLSKSRWVIPDSRFGMQGLGLI